MKEELVERIAHIQEAMNQSIANHNALAGRLEEAKFILDLLEKSLVVAPVVELVEQVGE